MEAIQMPSEEIRSAGCRSLIEAAKVLSMAAEFLGRYDDPEFAAGCAVEGINAFGGLLAMREVTETINLAGIVLLSVAITERSIPAEILAESFPGRYTDEGYALDSVAGNGDGNGAYL